MIKAALLLIAKMLKPPKCPSPDKQINKIWYTQTTGCDLAIKSNTVVTHTQTRMNHENIMLSEESRSERPPTVGFHSHKRSRISRSRETEGKWAVAWDLLGTGMRSDCSQIQGFFWGR